MFVTGEEAELKVMPGASQDWDPLRRQENQPYCPDVRLLVMVAHASEGADIRMTPVEAGRLIGLLERGIDRAKAMAARAEKKRKAENAKAEKKAKKK